MTETEGLTLLQEAARRLDKNDKASFRALMRRVEEQLPDSPQADALRGEMLLLSVAAGDVEAQDIYITLLRAEKSIRGPSRVLTPQMRYAENHYNVYLAWGKTPGRADEIRRRCENFDRIEQTLQRLTGFGLGIGACFQAQLAYYRGDFEQAKRFAQTDPAINGPDGQTSLIRTCMLEVLAGVAKHTMDQRLWRSSCDGLRALASSAQPASRACREQAAVTCAILEMSLGCLYDVPVWARTGDFGVIPIHDGYEIVRDSLLAGTLPSAMAAHVQYLSYSGAPDKALQAAAMLQQVFGIHAVVLDAYVNLLRAGCYFNLEKPEPARRAIVEALDCIAPDGLWLIAAEFVPAFGEALYAAAREYGADALERIRRIGEGFRSKLTPLRNDMIRGSGERLTRREQEIANLVMKGLSNAEIAEQMNITVRTVKYHLENIYSKLNITRRSQVVGALGASSVHPLADWVK